MLSLPQLYCRPATGYSIKNTKQLSLPSTVQPTAVVASGLIAGSSLILLLPPPQAASIRLITENENGINKFFITFVLKFS